MTSRERFPAPLRVGEPDAGQPTGLCVQAWSWRRRGGMARAGMPLAPEHIKQCTGGLGGLNGVPRMRTEVGPTGRVVWGRALAPVLSMRSRRENG